jgi:hypothetical protein
MLAMERDADRMGWRILNANRFGRSTERLSREEIKEEARSSPRDEGYERRRTRCQDGCAGYSREVEDDDGETRVAVPDERRLGCGMHIRSKFHNALLAKDGRAAIALKHFADLYVVEEDRKARSLSAAERLIERQRRSWPILDALDRWADEIHAKLLPKSLQRRATTYAINQRAFFRRCFTDGRFEIDNGRTERRIRNYALRRRAFLFTGSIPMTRLSELTPANWLDQKAAKQRVEEA